MSSGIKTPILSIQTFTPAIPSYTPSMRSWKKSASESVFSVHLPSFDAEQSTKCGSKKTQPRNRRPCGRCSDMQKKCDIAPPYSPTRCRACTMANIPFCPPHKARRSNNAKRSSSHTYNTRANLKDQTLSVESRPEASQSQYFGIDPANALAQPDHPSEAKEVENPSRNIEAVGLGFAPTDGFITSQAVPPMDNLASYDFEQIAFGGAIDASLALISASEYFAQSEDVANMPNFTFPVVFTSDFLSSL